MSADLSSIEGLNAKHIAVLAEALGIRTPGELVRADRRAIHTATRRLRPRPTLEDISTWQDHARDLVTAADPGWQQVAAFVVSFEQRDTQHGLERRVAAEQAEHAPPVPRKAWPQWQGAAVASWMLRQLRAELPEAVPSTEQPRQPGPAGRQDEPAAEHPDEAGPPVGVAAAAGPRPTLAIERAELLTPGKTPIALTPDAETEADVSLGTRLTVTVSGVAANQQIHVALRVRRPGRPALTPHPPISTTADTPIEIDLSQLPTGTHTAVVTAWTDDASAVPAVRKLPTLRVEKTVRRR